MDDLFGALDIATLKEVPNKGTYRFVLGEFRTFHSDNKGSDWGIFGFIKDDGTQFDGMKVEKWLRLYPNATREMLEDDPDVITAINAYKGMMRTLGVPDNELGSTHPSECYGAEVLIYGYDRDKRDGSGQEWVPHDVKPYK